MLQLKKCVRLASFSGSFRQALESAARIGADGVEVDARTGIRPAELSRTGVRHIKKMLADYRLKIAVVSFPTRRGYADVEHLEQRLDATRAAMSMAYDLGCNVVSNQIGIIPDAASQEKMTLLQALEDLGRHGQRVGVMFAARTGDDSGDTLAELIKQLGPGALSIDFDPAALAIRQFDVAAAMNVLASLVVHFRARDCVRDFSRREHVLVQLGRGSIDWNTLLARLETAGYPGYVGVEREPGPDVANVLAEELEYLQNLFQ